MYCDGKDKYFHPMGEQDQLLLAVNRDILIVHTRVIFCCSPTMHWSFIPYREEEEEQQNIYSARGLSSSGGINLDVLMEWYFHQVVQDSVKQY
jgi:hypothetical protein